ncbi:putative GNAT family N-acetyltransferase [Fusarium austroafricanum]|uniref:Putative GNAT family N-acetyltransferase n=1 Tax=Fusarium austroafricanum TaxID=2364996 RepID=A0A8H4KCU8_9HYPO|nr:putative GNAT family N-acetyltransferase [Fusarium austroafricanum]
MFNVIEDDLANTQSRDLVAFHLAGMNESVPPGAIFLSLSDLEHPEILPDGTGEIKSMRTHPDLSGHGAGTLILRTIIDAGKKRDIPRLSLETGSGSAFEAAFALYTKYGFKKGPAYSTYEQTDFNHFLHLDLR